MSRDKRIEAPDRALADKGRTIAEQKQDLAGCGASLQKGSAIISSRQSTVSPPRASKSQPTAPLRNTRRLLASLKKTSFGYPWRGVARLINLSIFSSRALYASVIRSGGVLGAISKARGVLLRDGFRGLKRGFLHIGIQAAGGYKFSKTVFDYSDWVEKYDTLNKDAQEKIRMHMATLRRMPLISVVMPVYNPDPEYLDKAILSVTSQIYPHWELCIADDASTRPEIWQTIERHVSLDDRVKVVYREVNGHICRATNSALELAQGEFVALLDHDDVMAEHALYWVAAELEAHPDADIIYSDFDLIDDFNQRHSPYFKSDFNLELMLGQNMVSHLDVYRHSLLKTVGGMRIGFEGSQDYDLFLRVFSQSTVERVRHIPAVLYHWRRSKQAPSYSAQHVASCAQAARRAIGDFLKDKGIAADVMPAPTATQWHRIRYRLPNPSPKVSIIIPTRNQAKLLARCINGLLNSTDYQSFDITIVDHASDDSKTIALLAQLEKIDRIKILHYSGVFNFSAINNFAVRHTIGSVLVFLNDDIEIIQSDWLRELVSHASRSGIGAVGAKLYYPNNHIQHAGVVTGIAGVAGHLYGRAAGNSGGMYGETLLTREISAVTAACMAISRNAFLDVGGFDEVHLPVAFNDVDLCLRLLARGYRNIFTPFAELIHHEFATRGSDLVPKNREQFLKEYQYMLARWSDILPFDRFFNPNRSLDITPKFAEPPRLPYPWEPAQRRERSIFPSEYSPQPSCSSSIDS